jgi:uncharacterized Ntn-hydrolase superfamily protein
MTLSIVARCSKTGDLGACTTTANLAVGNRVPHVESNVGAICTQAYTNVLYGINGLKLLKLGFSPQTALEAMLKEDHDRESRQVIIVDANNRTAAFTGRECVERKGHLIGDCYVVAGNKLVSHNVLHEVDDAFTKSEGNLGLRLLKAIEGGQASGGDERGTSSAALLVAKSHKTETQLNISLRVDYHTNPIKELRRVFEEYKRIYTSTL